MGAPTPVLFLLLSEVKCLTIYELLLFNQYKRASLACAARLADTACLQIYSGRLGILEKQYVAFLFYTKYAGLSFVYGYINEIRTVAEILFLDKYNLLRISQLS